MNTNPHISAQPAGPLRTRKGFGGFTRLFAAAWLAAAALVQSCGSDAPPMSKLENRRDSLPVMTTVGVSKMISDSGLMRYRIIAEEWRMYDKTKPPRQEFPKGIFLERLDRDFRMDLYIQADSAWCFNQNLWRLKGNVFVLDKVSQTTFRTQELFWNMGEHRFYSNRYMKVVKPDRQIEGDRFTANEQLTRYRIWKSKGFMPMPSEQESKHDTATRKPLLR